MKKRVLVFGIFLIALACSKSDESSPLVPVKHTLSVEVSEAGSVSTSGGQYEENTNVSITATPDQGYELSGWTGTTLTGNSISVKVSSNQTITLNFLKLQLESSQICKLH